MRLVVLNKRTYKNVKVRESSLVGFFTDTVFPPINCVATAYSGEKNPTKTLRVPSRIKTVHQKANLFIE